MTNRTTARVNGVGTVEPSEAPRLTDPLLSVKHVAVRLNVSTATVHRLI